MEKNGRIRIFVDAHSFDKEHQGTRAFIKRLYTHVSKAAPDIELFFGAYRIDDLRLELKELKCSFIRYRFKSSAARLLFEFPFIIKRHRIDLAHFQYISPLYKNCRTIVTTHDVLFLDFKNDFPLFYRISRSFLFRRSIRNADIKTTVSEYARQSIMRHFGISGSDLVVIENGISGDFLLPYDKNSAKHYIQAKYGISRYILYVSRIEPRKNHAGLLRSYLALNLYAAGYWLVMPGFTSIKDKQFSQLYGSLKEDVKKMIYLNENVPDEDLLQFYRGAEIFVFPSKSEGFGLPPIEAAALKVPVLCSNSTAMSDYTFFEPHRFNPANGQELQAKLRTILNDPPSAQKLEAIAAEVASRYLVNRSADKLISEIRKLFYA